MYSLPYFKENDPDEIMLFMQSHPFAIICGSDAAGLPVATQIPLLIDHSDGRIVFQGHIMRKTDHHRAFTENANVLVMFTGAHEYVSASWYSNPAQASTWNYMSVHAKGKIRFTDDKQLLSILERTTALFENNENSPASFDRLPGEYINRLSSAIVGFTISVDSIDNVFKLSQNRDKSSYEEIIKRLDEKGGDASVIAAEMSKRASRIFFEQS